MHSIMRVFFILPLLVHYCTSAVNYESKCDRCLFEHGLTQESPACTTDTAAPDCIKYWHQVSTTCGQSCHHRMIPTTLSSLDLNIRQRIYYQALVRYETSCYEWKQGHDCQEMVWMSKTLLYGELVNVTQDAYELIVALREQSLAWKDDDGARVTRVIRSGETPDVTLCRELREFELLFEDAVVAAERFLVTCETARQVRLPIFLYHMTRCDEGPAELETILRAQLEFQHVLDQTHWVPRYHKKFLRMTKHLASKARQSGERLMQLAQVSGHQVMAGVRNLTRLMKVHRTPSEAATGEHRNSDSNISTRL